MISTRRRLCAYAQIAFATMVLLGSTFEVVNLLVPSLMPEIQSNPMMLLHHEDRVIFWWTLLSNLATIPIALTLIVAGVRTARGNVDASKLAMKAAACFAAIIIGAAYVNIVHLIPPLLTKLSGDMRTIVLFSIASALVGVTGALLMIALGNRAIVRRA
jgi:hypothetical protein